MDYILNISDEDKSFVMTNEEVQQLGNWQVENQYEDMFRRYTRFGNYDKNTVDAVLRKKFNRK